MNEHERNVRECALRRIAKVFNVSIESLTDEAAFGEDLRASFVSRIKSNEFDLILSDIRDCADRHTLEELESGTLVIRTVGDYCDHMVRCLAVKPDDVAVVLQMK
jgi:hypothetical protein